MVRLGLVALDGTKIAANAAAAANRTVAHLQAQVAELLAQAAAADRAEDRERGGAGGGRAGAVAPGRAGGPAGPLPQRPGLLLCLWPPHPGGPLGAGAGPDHVRRLRSTLPA
jgi:hypothetical protein